MRGCPQLIDNFVFNKKRVMSRDYFKTYVVMSWDVLSAGVSTAG